MPCRELVRIGHLMPFFLVLAACSGPVESDRGGASGGASSGGTALPLAQYLL